MNWRRLGNLPVTLILRSPAHQVLSETTLLITVRGRKSGRNYTCPVNYVQEDDEILIMSQPSHTWWRNLIGGGPILVRLRGQEYEGYGEAVYAIDERARGLLTVLQLAPRYRRYAGITLTDTGDPVQPEALAAFAQRQILIRLSGLQARQANHQVARYEDMPGKENKPKEVAFSRRHPVVTYLGLVYALTWSIAIPLALSEHDILRRELPRELHYLAQFGPMVAALIVTGLIAGRAGLWAIGKRSVQWRIGAKWLAIAVGSPVALFAVAAAIARIVDGQWVSIRDLGEVNFLPYLGLLALPLWILTNGFGEETGWRGFLLPELQKKHSALGATLILGFFWALWHVPAFFYLPSYRDMEIYGVPGFVLGLLSGAVLLTWLYNSTSGSILAVALWHGLFNFFTASEAGQGTIAMVMSIAVMAWAIGLVFLAKPESLSRTRKPIMGHTLPGYTGT